MRRSSASSSSSPKRRAPDGVVDEHDRQPRRRGAGESNSRSNCCRTSAPAWSASSSSRPRPRPIPNRWRRRGRSIGGRAAPRRRWPGAQARAAPRSARGTRAARGRPRSSARVGCPSYRRLSANCRNSIDLPTPRPPSQQGVPPLLGDVTQPRQRLGLAFALVERRGVAAGEWRTVESPVGVVHGLASLERRLVGGENAKCSIGASGLRTCVAGATGPTVPASTPATHRCHGPPLLLRNADRRLPRNA